MTRNNFKRREFLSTVLGSSAVVSLSGAAPDVFCRAALADQAKADSGRADGRVLVVVQLSGGNDGLNTVVPFGNDVYRENRKTLRIARGDVLAIDKDYGLHPDLDGFSKLLENGQLGIVPSVGYDQPNRSHFESMDIWHTCRRKANRLQQGWLGHFLEASESTKGAMSQQLAGLHIGRDKQPLAMAARNLRIPSIASLEQFRLNTKGNKRLDAILNKALKVNETSDDLLGFLQSSTRAAVAANDRLQKVRSSSSASDSYPETTLGQKLSTIGRLIKAELPTSVYYVTHDGFDTHARQAGAHTSLLRQLSGAVTSLVDDMNSSGNGDRVMVLAFSEFGRRVAENASEGTDHGTAGPLFVAGGKVRSGFLGAHSDLNDLHDGDLKFKTDFRDVYAGILTQWFQFENAESILGGKYRPVEVLRS